MTLSDARVEAMAARAEAAGEAGVWLRGPEALDLCRSLLRARSALAALEEQAARDADEAEYRLDGATPLRPEGTTVDPRTGLLW